MIIDGSKTGVIEIEPYTVQTSGILVVSNKPFGMHGIAKVKSGDSAGKFCMYPAHAAEKWQTTIKTHYVLNVRDIKCFVEPEEGEEFVPDLGIVDYKTAEQRHEERWH